MLGSRTEIVGWVLAICLIVAMGVLVFTGPFHNINKTQAKSTRTVVTTALHVKIVTDTKGNAVGLYQPASLTVKKGQPIIFSNVSNAPHTVTAAGAFDSGNINTNASWRFTPQKTGTFHYICNYHPKMLGVLIVTG